VGRSLYLLGKHKAANDVYEEAHRIGASQLQSFLRGRLLLYQTVRFEIASGCLDPPPATESDVVGWKAKRR